MTEFFQDGPTLGNQYEEDRILRSFLRWAVPPEVLGEIEPGLRRLGQRAVTDILALGEQAEAQPPRHVPYDPWGRRIDRIDVSDAWKQLDGVAAEEGLIATGYERRHGAASRVHQLARLYLFHPSSAIYSCPLAMTDGAARAIELYGDDALKGGAFKRLTARDPARFWTSGQWMTERTGGSDVSGTSTIARLEDGVWRLYGTKWFTSATTSQMAMTLARIEGAPEGSRGLSLFYVELRDAEGRLQNIVVHRLKDKLGTKALPTAELTLNGTPARLVGDEGGGVRKISSLFNLTRIYNSVCAVGYMRRGIALARSYAGKRRAFGRLLADHPLHLETLSDLEVELQAAFLLTFHVARLLGREEVGEAGAEESAVLRMLTPIVKLYTAKQAVAVISEVLETFGGAGYVEDTGLPKLLRDAQVLPIWEGTTNVLALDALRAIDRDRTFGPFLADIGARLERVKAPGLESSVQKTREAAGRIEAWLREARAESAEFLEAGARRLAFGMARTYAASLLLEHAAWSLHTERDARNIAVARRWCAQELAPLTRPSEEHRAASRALGLDEGL